VNALRMLCSTASAIPLLAGCALFPQGIHPPESVFVDKELGKGALPPAAAASAARQDNVASSDSLSLARRLDSALLLAWMTLLPDSGASPGDAADTPANAKAVLHAGVAVMDHRCGVYFDALGRAAQRLNFASKELSLTTGVVAALQGLTGVAAKDISLSAAGLGFLAASSNAYADAFIFSPDVGSVEKMVIRGQDDIKARIGGMPEGDFTRANVISLLQGYEKTCEVKTVRRLVNESLASAQPVARFSDEDDPALALLMRATRTAVAVAVGAPSITDDQLIALYWLAYKEPPTTSEEKAHLGRILSNIPSVLQGSDASVPTGDALKSLRTAFAPLLTAGSAALDAKVAALKANIAAAAGANAGKPTTQRQAGSRVAVFPPSVTLSVLPGTRR
jgi:hypothetical protein